MGLWVEPAPPGISGARASGLDKPTRMAGQAGVACLAGQAGCLKPKQHICLIFYKHKLQLYDNNKTLQS
jgi:hypothetical protein